MVLLLHGRMTPQSGKNPGRLRQPRAGGLGLARRVHRHTLHLSPRKAPFPHYPHRAR